MKANQSSDLHIHARVGATDTFVGYAPQHEDFILPQSEDVEAAVRELIKY